MIKKKNILASTAENVTITGGDSIVDTIEDISDAVDTLQDSVDDIAQQDSSSIEIENNIDGHFIAECEACGGIFVSAVLESDNNAESIVGSCPICNKETTHDLKWIIRSVAKI